MNRNTRRVYNLSRKERKSPPSDSGRTVISKSPKKNLQMVVYRNLGHDKSAGNGSLTRFEAIDPNFPTNWPTLHKGRKAGRTGAEE